LTLLLAQQRSPAGREDVRPQRKLRPTAAGLRPGGQRRSVPLVEDGLLLRPASPHGRLASGPEGALKPSEVPRSPGPPKVVEDQPRAARGKPHRKEQALRHRVPLREAINQTQPWSVTTSLACKPVGE